MHIILVVALFICICNILWPMLINKISYEKSIMNYLKSNNFTNPHCYGTYLAIVSRDITGIKIKIGMDKNGYITGCNIVPDTYYTCNPFDYASQTHPCNQVKSYFHVFFIVNA